MVSKEVNSRSRQIVSNGRKKTSGAVVLVFFKVSVVGWLRLLALVLLPGFCLPASGMDHQGGLQPKSWSLVDSTGLLTFEQVRERFAAGDGQPVSATDLPTTGNGTAAWFRIQLPAVAQPSAFVLGVPQPGINSAEFYRPLPSGPAGETRWQVERSGDLIAVDRWPVRYLFPVFEVLVQPEDTTFAYLRVAHGHTIDVRFTLSKAIRFHENSKKWHLLLGLYGGLVLVIAMISGALALQGRGVIHGWFMGYVLLVTLTQSAMTGVAGEFFWASSPWWNDLAPVVLGLAGLAMLHLLLRELVVDRDLRWIPGALGVMAVASLPLIAGFLLDERQTFFPFVVPYVALSLAVQLCAAGWYAWRSPRAGLCVLAGVACLAAGATFPLLRVLNIIPVSAATQYGAQIGSALEITLLMLALHLRSNFRDNQRRVGAMSRVDPLTGLANHRMLLRRLEQLLQRRQRDPTAGAVIRVRVANAVEIRQEYGMDAAQSAVVYAGACIASLVQEGDTVARHKDGDFVVVLSGRLTREQLTSMGQRLIVLGLAPNHELPPHTVLQLKLAVMEAPLRALSPVVVLQTLGSVLDELNGRSGTALRFVTDRGSWRGSGARSPA